MLPSASIHSEIVNEHSLIASRPTSHWPTLTAPEHQGLRLIDVGTTICCHVQDAALLDLPNSLVELLHVLPDEDGREDLRTEFPASGLLCGGIEVSVFL